MVEHISYNKYCSTDVIDGHGLSPLQAAVHTGNWNATGVLLNAGANVDVSLNIDSHDINTQGFYFLFL